MITTQQLVVTPSGQFTAMWDENEDLPVSYAGDDDAIAFFKAHLALNLPTGRTGALLKFDTLEPDDLYGFGQSQEFGILVLPEPDDMLALLLDDVEHEDEADDVPLLDGPPSVQASINRGLASLEKALKNQTTVHRAMYREELGWIDFVWGDEGKWPPNSKGVRQGGKGISHVLEARQRKDGFTEAQAHDLLRRMVYAIGEGEERRQGEGKGNKVFVGKDGTEAVLLRGRGSNNWALTAYDIDPQK